jgi:hypothetical protein
MVDRGRDPLTTLTGFHGGGMHAGVHRDLTRSFGSAFSARKVPVGFHPVEQKHRDP